MEAATIPTAQEIHRMKISLTDAVTDGLEAAKKVGKTTSDAAEELMDDTAERIRRHPAETVVFAFIAGFLIGGFVSWLTRQKSAMYSSSFMPQQKLEFEPFTASSRTLPRMPPAVTTMSPRRRLSIRAAVACLIPWKASQVPTWPMA